jgi:hypothetical protein
VTGPCTAAWPSGDPEVPEPGSFFWVCVAYCAGRLTAEQYAALARAAAR